MAARIENKNFTMLGFDAVIDCNGSGVAFSISGSDSVVISGFDIYNAVGGRSNWGKAGGIDARNSRSVSVLSSSFHNCTGLLAGAISIQSDIHSAVNSLGEQILTGNVVYLHNLTLINSYNSRWLPGDDVYRYNIDYASAGSISVNYRGYDSDNGKTPSIKVS